MPSRKLSNALSLLRPHAPLPAPVPEGAVKPAAAKPPVPTAGGAAAKTPTQPSTASASTPSAAQASTTKAQTPSTKTPASTTKPQTQTTPPSKGQGTLGRDEAKFTARPKAKPAEPPAPTLVTTPAEAVAACLKGETVLLRQAGMFPLRLEINRQENGAFEFKLDDASVIVLKPAMMADGPFLEAVVRFALAMPRAERSRVRRVEPTGPSNDVYSQFSAQLVGPNGQVDTVRVSRGKGAGGKVSYEIQYGGVNVPVKTAPDDADAHEVEQVYWMLRHMPAHLRPMLEELTVNDTPNPDDGYFAEHYKMPGFTSAASAANGEINIWSGPKNMQDEVVFHEFGHLIAQRYSKSNALVPDGWTEAIAADKNVPSSYGGTNPTEDFAESWMLYVKLRNGEKHYNPTLPQTLEAFATVYPARLAILAAIYDNTRRPAR